MALYENVAKVRKLIGMRRVKMWVAPGEQVDLDSTDARHLGGNSAFMSIVVKKKKVEKKEPVKKTTFDKAQKQQEKKDRKNLKEYLEEMTKARIVEVAEDVGINVFLKDKKTNLIKQVLHASKDKGYRYILENS